MIEITLKCKCTLGSEVKIFVRERRDGEDIGDWMMFVQRQAGEWHIAPQWNAMRPCFETRLEYLKVPLSDKPGAVIGRK